MNLIRIGFLWERLQPTLGGPLDPACLAQLMPVTSQANRHGAAVLDFGRYPRKPLGSPQIPIQAFAHLWSRSAEKFADNRVMFRLMNEPHDQSRADWRSAVDAAAVAIRKTGAKNTVFIVGADWGNPRSWMSGNAELMAGIKDPDFVFEFRQCLDAMGGGTSPVCKDAAHPVALLSEAADWLRRTDAHGFIGEVGIGGQRPDAWRPSAPSWATCRPTGMFGWDGPAGPEARAGMTASARGPTLRRWPSSKNSCHVRLTTRARRRQRLKHPGRGRTRPRCGSEGGRS